MAYTQHEFALLQSIGVLQSLGLEFKELSFTKGSLSFLQPYFSSNFLTRNHIINEPLIKIENFSLIMSEGFQIQLPTKEALMQSALKHYEKDGSPKRIDMLVEYTYRNALRCIKQKEQAFTASFLLSINENLKHLSEALLDLQAREVCYG